MKRRVENSREEWSRVENSREEWSSVENSRDGVKESKE